MDKQDIWFALSEQTYKKMPEYAAKCGLPKVRSKFILNVLFSYTPPELLRDYTFVNHARKMVCASINQDEANAIQNLAKRYDRTVSALARDLLYTLFKERNEL